MIKNISIFCLIGISFLSSCISFKPESIRFVELTSQSSAKTENKVRYALSQIQPDTANALFDYDDLREINVIAYLLQVENNSAQTVSFSESNIEGVIPALSVYKKTKKSTGGLLGIDLVGSTMIGYLTGFAPEVLAGLGVITLGHLGVKASVDKKRKKHVLAQAPGIANINPNETKEIVFFMDTLEHPNSQVLLKVDDQVMYKILIPKEKYKARFVYINASTGISVIESETYQSIANLYKITLEELYEYNDLDRTNLPDLKANDILFISPKRKKGDIYSHTIEEGETMYQISQKYAIQLQSLYEMNSMEEGTEPKVGELIALRGFRGEAPALKE